MGNAIGVGVAIVKAHVKPPRASANLAWHLVGTCALFRRRRRRSSAPPLHRTSVILTLTPHSLNCHP